MGLEEYLHKYRPTPSPHLRDSGGDQLCKLIHVRTPLIGIVVCIHQKICLGVFRLLWVFKPFGNVMTATDHCVSDRAHPSLQGTLFLQLHLYSVGVGGPPQLTETLAHLPGHSRLLRPSCQLCWLCTAQL